LHDVGFEQLGGIQAHGIEAGGQCLGAFYPALQVAFVQLVGELVGGGNVQRGGRNDVVFGNELGLLLGGELLPVGVGGELVGLGCESLCIGRQFGVERLAQDIHAAVEQGPHRVGLHQQAALVGDGLHFRLQTFIRTQFLGVVEQVI